MGRTGEPKQTALAHSAGEALVAQAMGGRMQVRWDETAQATPHAQIVCFVEFLATDGLFDRWVDACPLHDSSPNASRACDVLDTLIRAAQPRAAHGLAAVGRAASHSGQTLLYPTPMHAEAGLITTMVAIVQAAIRRVTTRCFKAKKVFCRC